MYYKLIPLILVLSLTISSLVGIDNSKSNLTTEYLLLDEVYPSQTRISNLAVQIKIDQAVKLGAAVWDDSKNNWTLKYNLGTSILPISKALPVVQTSFGYVLVDGHHDVLSSLKLNSKTIPAQIVADLSHLETESLWKVLEEKGYAYLYLIGGERTLPPKNFSELYDDPNRYFATIIGRKYDKDPSGSYLSAGSEYPVWIKIGKDIPFIEFKIADVLYNAGFTYSEQEMDNPPSEKYCEIAREILYNANIPGLRVVPQRTHYELIDIKL